jgi:hypothetical protein
MSRLSQKKYFFLLFFSSTLLLFLCSSAEASVTLAWDKPATNADGTPCTDLAGYKVYYDTDSAAAPYGGTGLVEGNSPITVPVSSLTDPARPELALSGLSPSATYHLTVTAYDTSGNESGYSNVITIPANTPPTATVTATPTQGSAPLTVSFNGTGTDTDGTVISYSWTFLLQCDNDPGEHPADRNGHGDADTGERTSDRQLQRDRNRHGRNSDLI